MYFLLQEEDVEFLSADGAMKSEDATVSTPMKEDTTATKVSAGAHRITTRYMTKYEKARVLGTRALQLRCVMSIPLSH